MWALAVVLLAFNAGVAHAAPCARAATAQLQAARTMALQLEQAGSAGAADAARIARRANCRFAPFAHAVVRSTTAGPAVPGRSYRSGWVRLRGTHSANGSVYRLDPAATVAAWQEASGAGRRRILQRASALTVAMAGGRAWVADPTSPSLDPAVQVQVAAALSGGDGGARDQARAAIAAVSVRRSRQLSQGPLMHALATAVKVDAIGRRLHGRHTARLAAGVSRRSLSRVRSASKGSWARVDGRWATAAEQRRLARLASRIAARRSARDRRLAAHLLRQLRSSPRVKFLQLPGAPFFPHPADGALDTSAAVLHVDKPATAHLYVFAEDKTLVRTVTSSVEPGRWTAAWNGANAAGAIVPAGRYRYSVRLIDPAGNRRHLPGLGTFNVAADGTPPQVRSARVRHLSGRRRRVIEVTWSVHEQHSPRLNVQLLIRGGGIRRDVPLRTQAVTGGGRISVRLKPGPYRTYLQVTDGSGNTVLAPAGRLRLR